MSELSLLLALGWIGLFGLLGWRVWFRRTQALWLGALSVCALLTGRRGDGFSYGLLSSE